MWCQYYKSGIALAIGVNYALRVMLLTVASVIDDSKRIIYYWNMFIVKPSGFKKLLTITIAKRLPVFRSKLTKMFKCTYELSQEILKINCKKFVKVLWIAAMIRGFILYNIIQTLLLLFVKLVLTYFLRTR